MGIHVLVVLLEVGDDAYRLLRRLIFVLLTFGGNHAIHGANDDLEGLVTPDELFFGRLAFMVSRFLREDSFVSAFELVDIEAERLHVVVHFGVGDAAVEVVVHLAHQLVDLALCDGETHLLEQIMELLNLDEVVLVTIYLIKDLAQSQSTLVNHLEQMVKDLVLRAAVLLLLLLLYSTLDKVHSNESLKLRVLDHAVAVVVDFAEQLTNFVLFER